MNRVKYIKKLISVHGTAWRGHGEFAMNLVEILKPDIVVDLGVDYGFSTFCFAQPKIGTVYGVDWFQGDEHAQYRNTYQFVKTLQSEVNTEFGINNVEIIKSDFTELSKIWSKKIDILHIDGLHTYDAVKSDFTNWIDHCNEDALILFHDTISFPKDVGRFFNEIKDEFYNFNFKHCHGLGVLTKNEKTFDSIGSLLNNQK